MLPELTQLDSLRVFMTTETTTGLWHYGLDLAQGLRAYDTNTTLCVLGPEPTASQAATARRIPGLKLICLDLPRNWHTASPAQVLDAAEQVAAMAREEGVRMVHLNSPLLAADAHYSTPVVTAWHSCIPTWWQSVRAQPFDHSLDWHKNAIGTGLACSDAVIAPSGAFAQVLFETYGLAKLPYVIHSGRRPSTREGLPDGDAVPTTDFAFTAGRLWDDGKNLRALDKAAGLVSTPVYAAGPISGADGSSIAFENIRALGNLCEGHLAEWLAAKPTYVSTACYEPFGLRVLEAAEAGCPLILSDIPTFRELWEGAAEFVPCEDAEAVAGAIARVSADSTLRARLASAARRRARRYTAEVMAAKVRAIYGGLLRKTTRQRPRSEVAA